MPDGSDITITVVGVDAIEAHGVEPERAGATQTPEIISLPAPARTLCDTAESPSGPDPTSQDGELIVADSDRSI